MKPTQKAIDKAYKSLLKVEIDKQSDADARRICRDARMTLEGLSPASPYAARLLADAEATIAAWA